VGVGHRGGAGLGAGGWSQAFAYGCAGALQCTQSRRSPVTGALSNTEVQCRTLFLVPSAAGGCPRARAGGAWGWGGARVRGVVTGFCSWLCGCAPVYHGVAPSLGRFRTLVFIVEHFSWFHRPLGVAHVGARHGGCAAARVRGAVAYGYAWLCGCAPVYPGTA